MLHTLRMVLRARAEILSHLIVPTMFDRRTRSSIDSLKELRREMQVLCGGGVIPD